MAEAYGPVTRLRVYGHLLRAQVRSQASYRASFLMDLFGNALMPVVDVATVLVVFRVTRDLGGFAAAEVMIMFGLTAIAFALADMVIGNVEKLRYYVRQGLLDGLMVRPLSPLGQIVAMDFTVRRIARVAVSVAVLAIALERAGVGWTPARVAVLLVTPVFGAIFYGALFVATASVAFWWIDSGEFASAFTYGGRDFASYPITVYGGLFRRLFAYSLGFAFVSYYPTLALLGRPDPLGMPAWAGWAGPAVALVAAALAGLVWRIGLRHYRSTGS